MYHEFQPNPLLCQFVETYWVADGYVNGTISSKIFPDGCVDIIFTFGDRPTPEGMKPYCPYIVGTTTSFIEVVYSGKVQMLGIRFRPVGITAFTRIPVNEFTDRHIDIHLLETLFDKNFNDSLPEKPDIKDKLQYIDNYLINKLKRVYDLDNSMVNAVKLISDRQGLSSLTEIAGKVCLCPQHFERRFKQAVGISPKTFSKVIRFNYARNYIKQNTGLSLTAVATDCGYYDHAHLIREFNSFTGESPSGFRG